VRLEFMLIHCSLADLRKTDLVLELVEGGDLLDFIVNRGGLGKSLSLKETSSSEI
jgi:hypothetical protein